MKNVSIAKVIISIMLVLLMTSCESLEERLGESAEVTTEQTEQVTEDTITTTEDTSLLIEFNDYTTTKNDDGTFNITITQDAVEDSYYTLSLMYDDRIVEYVSGEGYYTSAYGSFEEETIVTDDEDDTEIVTTLSKEELESKLGKEGKWVLKSTSEGTQYIEIKLIDKYGDIYAKYQFTCIVDTHLEPHIYYTTINY